MFLLSHTSTSPCSGVADVGATSRKQQEAKLSLPRIADRTASHHLLGSRDRWRDVTVTWPLDSPYAISYW